MELAIGIIIDLILGAAAGVSAYYWAKYFNLKRKKEDKSSARFEIYRDSDKEWRFKLVGANNKIVAVSEGYKRIAGCVNGIEMIKENAKDAPVKKE